MIVYSKQADNGGSPMKTASSPRTIRILVGIACPAVITILCVLFARGKLSLVCIFHELTGLYCPGCGSGRAFAALLRGDIRASFMHNMLCYILGIPSIIILIREYLGFVFPALEIKPTRISNTCAMVCLAVIILFTALRNIPAFYVLAP